MKITIDNGDGLGAVDYTPMVSATGPVVIERVLNTPSRCTLELVPAAGVAMPVRRGRVVVTNAAGVTLFTGYLPTEPAQVYAGQGVTGAIYKVRVSALSDEWLLDQQGVASSTTDGLTLSLDSATAVRQLVVGTQGATGTVSVGAGESARALGAFAVQPGASWSSNAAAAANATYATYRAVAGTVSVLPAGAVVHALSDADGTLAPAAFDVAHLRELANDVTVSGEEEPAALVQEIFYGDGTTELFTLSQAAFRGLNRSLVADNFDEATINTLQWTIADGGSAMSLTGAGLSVQGGNGADGQTTLTAVSALEMGGALVAEMSGVVLGAASNGMLSGFYSGAPVLASCFAGWHVRQSTSTSGGNTVLVPVVNGVEAGTTFTPVAGHNYTLRLRLYSIEMQRVSQRYYCMADGVVEAFGSAAGIGAPMQVVFELVDEGAASNTPATVLYDAAASGAVLTNSPATCSFVLVNAVSLFASIRGVQVTRTGSLWVESTLTNGTVQTRLIGEAGQGVDCEASYGSSGGAAGKLQFLAGRIPAAGERLTVSYRSSRRSVARLQSNTSVAAEETTTLPGVSRWLGKVVSPAARSSADCEAAAETILAMATARSAALTGRYTALNPGTDVWPGDVLSITSGGMVTAMLVRSVTLTDGHAAPELVAYNMTLANDWATVLEDGLGVKLANGVAADAALPQTAASGPAAVLANLQQMSLVGLTGSALQIDAGLDAPSGGGFEVRRRDWAFGADVDAPDLVLRSPVRSFSIPRAAQVERFYVRMYDGSTPPVYSRFSSALFVNWPLDETTGGGF